MLRLLGNFLALTGLCLLLGCSFLTTPVKRTVRTPQRSPSVGVSATPTADGSNPPETVPPTSEPVASLDVAPSDTFAPTPSVTLTPTITLTLRITRTPTLTPTITSTPTLNPKAILLRIAAPGPMSKVVSPIDFVVHISPDFVGNTRIELIGEDGRQLYTKTFRTFATDSTTKVSEKVAFEIHGAAETARLQISTFDKGGHMQALNSVRLLLLSVGETQLNPPYPPVERVLLRAPKWDDEVSGGVLDIQGEIQPMNDLPMVMELFDVDGNLLGSRILTLQHADGAYQPFNATIPYKVDKKMAARLVIRQDDDRIQGLAYLYSVECFVSP